MAKKDNSWSQVKLRKAIGDAIYSRHLQNGPIDKEAIKARYLGKSPNHAQFIKSFVDSYTGQLKAKTKGTNQTNVSGLAQSSSSPALSSPARQCSPKQSSSTPASNGVPLKQPSTGPSVAATHISASTTHRDMVGSDGDLYKPSLPELNTNNDIDQQAHSVRLKEFTDHLAGNSGKGPSNGTLPGPSLEVQRQFLTSFDTKGSIRDSLPTENAVLMSPCLGSRGCKLPPQYALLGGIATAIPDNRIMLNTNIPFSAFLCGVQGSVLSLKRHSLENCSMTMPALGTLQRSISTLILQYDEYSSALSSQPSEAAFLARVMPQYAQERPLPLRVLVSPTNFHNLKNIYSQIPNIEVRPFRLQPKHLTISMMLSLMSISQSGTMPLYMAQVTRILRQMAMEQGGCFDYADFRARLNALNLDRTQTPFLYQRLDLLDSYLDISGKAPQDYFVDGGITILDLSCPFVDQSTACILFRIAIELFLHTYPSRGKMIVADEAHKYMTDTPAAKVLTETFLTIIRQQRHLGVRTIISTQEPTISSRLIDLCSLTVIHRFTSPEWYETIRKHVPMDSSEQVEGERIPVGLYRIASLRTGEAIVFAPSAHVVGEDEAVIDTKHHPFNMMMRKRVTWDGGKSIVCIR
ncbi:hypothetical protein AbraIFM66950_011071 [Aspergillus brasiliensis]|nr:hypothetical protein AbraIFM66950_011071 [Aspergillus brasiliensis]